MSLRIPMGWHVLCGFAIVLALAGVARADDPATVKQLQETVTKLEKKIADLEAKVAALEKYVKLEPGRKPDKSDEEFVTLKAGALLEGLLAGDASVVRGAMTTTLHKTIDGAFEIGSVNHNTLVDKWIESRNPKKQYKSYVVDRAVFSPGKVEVVLIGTLKGKDDAEKGAFKMTLVWDKDRYMLDTYFVKEK